MLNVVNSVCHLILKYINLAFSFENHIWFNDTVYCVESVQIRSFSCLYFPAVRLRGTPYLYVFSPNAGKYGPGKTAYFDTFHAVVRSFGMFRYILFYQFFILYKDIFCRRSWIWCSISKTRNIFRNILGSICWQ